jgi:hypothetical protein
MQMALHCTERTQELNLAHSKEKANSNYTEIPFLSYQVSKTPKDFTACSVGIPTFRNLSYGYIMKR